MSGESTAKTKDFKSTEDDVEYVVQMARWLMKPLGLWPIQSSSYPPILRLFLVAICSFLLTFMFVPSVLYMFLIVKDFQIRLKLVGPLSFTTMNLCKYFGILHKSRDIRRCISLVAEDWQDIKDPSERDFMLENTKVARKFTFICALLMYGGGLPYTIVMPIILDAAVVDNETIRPFSYQGYYMNLFNPNVSPNFEIVYSIHCLCGLVTYTITIAFLSIAIVFILHVCGQTAIVSWKLQSLANKYDDRSLGNIVSKHIKALRFASKLENILNVMLFSELCGCCFNICMLGFYFITEIENESSLNIPLLVFFLLFTSFLCNIFMISLLGNYLTESCNMVGIQAYHTVGWYDLPAKEARNMMFILFSTHRSVKLTAGKIFTFSLMNFTSIIKISFSYLNLLRTITH